MGAGIVNFRVGKGIGIICANIAQEHLIYDYDIDKAIRVFEDGFGMHRDLAVKCLFGKDYIIRDGNEGQIIVTEREDKDFEYPQLNCPKIVDDWLNRIDIETESWDKFIHSGALEDTDITINIPVKELINGSRTINDVFSEFTEDEHEGGYYLSKIDRLKEIYKWFDETDKLLNVIDFMLENKMITYDDINGPHLNVTYNYITYSIDNLKYTMEKWEGGESIPSTKTILNNNIQRFLDAEKKINEDIKKKSIEVDTSKITNAIWMDPDGKMYGLNGEIANMLHCTIADKLVEDGIIEFDKSKYLTADRYLECSGWLKIHNDWVMFDPYASLVDDFDGKIKNHVTHTQAKVLLEYLENNFDGKGQFGIHHHVRTAFGFYQMDYIMRNSLFEY